MNQSLLFAYCFMQITGLYSMESYQDENFKNLKDFINNAAHVIEKREESAEVQANLHSNELCDAYGGSITSVQPTLIQKIPARFVAFSSCSNLFAAALKNEMHLYELDKNDNTHVIQQLKDHTDNILSIAFDRCGKFLASSSMDETVRFYALDQNNKAKLLHQLTGFGSSVTSIAFSPYSRFLASATHKKVYIDAFDDQENKLKPFKILADKSWYSGFGSIVFGHSDKFLVFEKNSKISMYALRNDRYGNSQFIPLHELNNKHFGDHLALSPCDKFLAATAYPNAVCIFALPEGSTKYRYPFNCKMKKPKLTQELGDHAKEVTSVAFSSCGKILASSSLDKTVCLYAMNKDGNATFIHQLKDYNHQLSNVAFNTRDKLFVSASHENFTYFYDLAFSQNDFSFYQADFKEKDNEIKKYFIKTLKGEPDTELTQEQWDALKFMSNNLYGLMEQQENVSDQANIALQVHGFTQEEFALLIPLLDAHNRNIEIWDEDEEIVAETMRKNFNEQLANLEIEENLFTICKLADYFDMRLLKDCCLNLSKCESQRTLLLKSFVSDPTSFFQTFKAFDPDLQQNIITKVTLAIKDIFLLEEELINAFDLGQIFFINAIINGFVIDIENNQVWKNLFDSLSKTPVNCYESEPDFKKRRFQFHDLQNRCKDMLEKNKDALMKLPLLAAIRNLATGFSVPSNSGSIIFPEKSSNKEDIEKLD